MVYSKIFRAARANLLSILKEKAWKMFGGDVTKNSDFIKGKMVVLYQFSGGDATENGDFQKDKQRLQWYIFFQYSISSWRKLIF